MRRWLGRAPALLLVGAMACAYYNGLYNANRLVGEAEKAEREGRTGEARSLWSQAAVKAESVATRYSKSKWRDDALYLWGQGLKEAGQCRLAENPLSLAVDSSPDPKLRNRARLVLGECLIQEGRYDSAVTVLTAVAAQDDEDLAARGHLWRGRAEIERGRFDEAAADLEQADPEAAAFDLATAYLALGRADDAELVLDARVPGAFDELSWDDALDELGAASQPAASRIVDRLITRGDLTPGERARFLLADGARWAAVGESERASERFALALSAAPDSVESSAARVELALTELRESGDVDRMVELVDVIQEGRSRGGVAAEAALPYLQGLQTAAVAVQDPEIDPTGAVTFGITEFLRDSVGAERMAVALLWRLQRDHPESFVAPKALLAVAAHDPEAADSALSLLEREYPESPYRLALLGGGGAEYQAAEDSLRVLIALGLGGEVGAEGERGVADRAEEGRPVRRP
jgi:tetratricopeptide (TPR) repeat protein